MPQLPFPKLSAPLVKDIRTGEGVAEWALGIAVSALTACGDLSVVKGTTYLLILAALKGARRGLIKLTAAQSPYISGGPILPSRLPTVADEVGKVEKESATVAAATAKAAETPIDPGTTDAGA